MEVVNPGIENIMEDERNSEEKGSHLPGVLKCPGAKRDIDENPSKPCEDFDEILELIGSNGKFQKRLLYAVLCPVVTVTPLLVLNIIFMWDIPDHFCHVPGQSLQAVGLAEWKNLTLPWELGPDGLKRYSRCKMIEQSTGKEIECQFGWEYEKIDYENTIPSEFDWVCEKDHYATDCFTWAKIGSAIGTVFFGIMADKYGRKRTFFLACFTNLVFRTGSLFWANNHRVYMLLQFIGGLAYPAVFSMPVLLGAEVSGATYRSWVYVATWGGWVLGNSVIPLVAWICRSWFLFGVVTAIPGFCLFFYYPFIDESARWLVTVGKGEKAIGILLKIAHVNGSRVKPERVRQMVEELVRKIKKDSEGEEVGVWALFCKFRIAKNTMMLIFAWTMSAVLYYGLTLNTTRMAGNRFLNYFLLSVIELPGGLLAGKLVEKTGRRWTQAVAFLLCAISSSVCAIAVMYPEQIVIVTLGTLVIKFGVTVCTLVAYLQSTEIFPTRLRSTGSGLASTVASTIAIFGPYIVYSGSIHVSLPYAILGVCSILGVLSSALLPETLKQHLPETLEDANKFGKEHRFWSYLPNQKSTPL